MTILSSLSERLRRLSSRERRVLLGGAVATVLILVGTLGVAPFVRHWRDREASIAAKTEQLARLEALAASEESLNRDATELRGALDRRDQSLVDGSTLALAGSSLQSLIRGYGQRSRVSVFRLEPAGSAAVTGAAEPFEGSELAPVSLSVTARGDIYGLVDLLYYLHNGEKLLVVDELRVNAPGPTAPALMSWTLRLRGFYETRGGE